MAHGDDEEGTGAAEEGLSSSSSSEYHQSLFLIIFPQKRMGGEEGASCASVGSAGKMQPQNHYNKYFARSEAIQLLNLAVPTVIIELGSTLPPALTASWIGQRLGKVHLDGFTLANLTGNLITLTLLSGLYMASDTLSPQAFGAGNFKEVGLLAIRGYVASLLMIVCMNILLVPNMESLLILARQDPETSRLASQWYRIYVLGLPFYALFMVVWKFLSAQGIMRPLLGVMVLSCGIVLPLSLEMLIDIFGFLGSACAIVFYQLCQAAMLILYLAWKRPFHPETWPGLVSSWREAFSSQHFLAYMKLGAGGIVATSEWMYWEVISLLVGTFGVVPLSAHTVATQVITVAFMLPLGTGIALAVRLGATLAVNVETAKKLALWTFLGGMLLTAALTIFMYTERGRLFRIFTDEKDVLEMCDRIWWKVCFYNFNVCVFGLNTGIATGLGMQWTLGFVATVALWGVGLPSLFFFSELRGGGFDMLWTCVYPPYIVMNIILIHRFYEADWTNIGELIQRREGIGLDFENGFRIPIECEESSDEAESRKLILAVHTAERSQTEVSKLLPTPSVLSTARLG